MKKTLAVLAVAGMMLPCMAFAQQADTTSAEHGAADAGYHSQMNAGMTDTNKRKHHRRKSTASGNTTNGTSNTMNSGSNSNGTNTNNTSSTPK